MKTLLSTAALVAATSCGMAHAQGEATGAKKKRAFADIYTECGLGTMIAPKNAAVAAVTNVTWDLGTTAISSDDSSEDARAARNRRRH